MHDRHATDYMIKAFLARKAEQFPQIFKGEAPEPARRKGFGIRRIDVVLS